MIAPAYGDVSAITAALCPPILTVERKYGRTSWWERLLRFPRGELIWWERLALWLGLHSVEFTVRSRTFRLFQKTRTYTGRILSHPEWSVFEPELIKVATYEKLFRELGKKGEAPELEIVAAYRLTLDTLLPAYLSAIRIPVDVVLGLPLPAQMKAFGDFLFCQPEVIALLKLRDRPANGPAIQRANASRNGGTKSATRG